MDINLQKQEYYCTAVLSDKAYEQQVSADVTLPDYMPEIVRIVRCNVYPKINSCSAVGERVTVDGVAVMTLVYSCGDGKIHSYDTSQSFVKTCEISGAEDGDCLVCGAEAGYLNCRASAANRAEFRGSITITVRAARKVCRETVCDADAPGIQLKKQTISSFSGPAESTKTFSMSEVVEIPSACDSAESLISSLFTPCGTEVKQISNKLMLKGELYMRFNYASKGNGAVRSVDSTIPVNQIIEVDGLTENSLCSVNLKVMSFDTALKENADGDKRLIDTAVTVNAVVLYYEPIELTLINDAYSTACDVALDTERVNIVSAVETYTERFVTKNGIDISGSGVREIFTVDCDKTSYSVTAENGAVKTAGTLKLVFTGVDGVGEIISFERAFDFENTKLLDKLSDDAKLRADVSVGAVDFVMNSDERAEVRAEIHVSAIAETSASADVLTDIRLNEAAPGSSHKGAHITVCFAEGGESLWDIARKYNTTVDAIAAENAVSGDTVSEKRMLIIPGI